VSRGSEIEREWGKGREGGKGGRGETHVKDHLSDQMFVREILVAEVNMGCKKEEGTSDKNRRKPEWRQREKRDVPMWPHCANAVGDSSRRSSGRIAWRTWSVSGKSLSKGEKRKERKGNEGRTRSPVVVPDLDRRLHKLPLVRSEDIEGFLRELGCFGGERRKEWGKNRGKRGENGRTLVPCSEENTTVLVWLVGDDRGESS
jgi:hypothetical protein